MKHLKTYGLFESRTGLTKGQENFLNKYTEGTWTYNPATGLVDVEGGFNCSYEKLKDLKGVRFGKVSGSFKCHNNQLTSLEGAPQKVGGDFLCQRNNLTSLEGAPQKVGGSFDCARNKLTSLKGAPQELDGAFWCDAFEIWGDRFARTNTEWNLKGWLKVLREGSPEAQKLIPTIFSAEELNKEISKDPAGMAMKLKVVWNDENFKEIRTKLVWPKGYEEEADLVGDLDDVGF